MLARSREGIEASLARAVEGGKLESAEAEAALARITPATDLDDLSGAQLVVEAVYEDAQVKAAVFRELDRLLPPETPLASNTSSIPIAQLAAATSHPERVLGLHFFSPGPGDAPRRGRRRPRHRRARSSSAPRRSCRRSASSRSAPRIAPASSSTCCWCRT